MTNRELTHNNDSLQLTAGVLIIIVATTAALLTVVLTATAQITAQTVTRKTHNSFSTNVEHDPDVRIFDKREGDTIDLGYVYEWDGKAAKYGLVFKRQGKMQKFPLGAPVSFMVDGQKRWEAGEAYLIDYYFLKTIQVETVRLDLSAEELARLRAKGRSGHLLLKLGEYEIPFGANEMAVLDALYEAGEKR